MKSHCSVVAWTSRTCMVLLALGSGVAAPAVSAADGAELTERIVIVGSRRAEGRSPTESLVPVDVFDGSELQDQGATDMDSLLANIVPSYNVDQQAINDAATLVRPARFRGLPPDTTLTLVNGKRRHRAAVITFLGNGVADGSHGPDISVIPSIALKRVEVLRDGAAAQYGSDAIGGVINFELRDDRDSREVDVRWGRFYEGDGETADIAANIGLPLTDAGFANFSLEYRTAGGTNRSQQRDDALALISAGNRYITDEDYNRVFHPNVMIWGAPDVAYDLKLFGNLGINLGDNREAYAFGNFAEREVQGGFYFRNPHTRNGVFRGDPVTIDGTTYDTVKVADLSADGVSGNCPPIRIMGNVANAGDLAAVESNPDCFSFISAFPGGFTPRFGGTVTDASGAMGVRGNLTGDWTFDLSAVVGSNDVDFLMQHTINPQLLAKLAPGQRKDIPTDYRPGSYTETDATLNFDLLRPIFTDIFFEPINFAMGFELRREQFKVESGEENSWYIDDRAGGLAEQGFGIGSNGFTGFGPRLAGEFNRTSRAVYVDVEVAAFERLRVAVAGRHEYHEGIGETKDGKVTGRWQLSDALALRAGASTGFRAPTVGQANILNVTTAFTGGVLADEATLPATHPAAQIVGAQPLMPELSTNVSAGAVLTAGNFDLTVDYFQIAMTDRIARSSDRVLTPDNIALLLSQGIADAQSFTSVRFYTNNFDTTTRGVDVSAGWTAGWFGGTTRFRIAGNWTNTEVDERDPDVINDKRVVQLEENTPAMRYVLSANHTWGQGWQLLARARHYDGFVEFSTDDASARLDADPRVLVDVELSFAVDRQLTMTLGAENVLDEYPTRQHRNVSGLLYAETAPYGSHGGFYYVRLAWRPAAP